MSRDPPPSASPPGAGPPPVVLSGVPPIAPLANQPDGVASEESSSVDVCDNQFYDDVCVRVDPSLPTVLRGDFQCCVRSFSGSRWVGSC